MARTMSVEDLYNRLKALLEEKIREMEAEGAALRDIQKAAATLKTLKEFPARETDEEADEVAELAEGWRKTIPDTEPIISIEDRPDNQIAPVNWREKLERLSTFGSSAINKEPAKLLRYYDRFKELLDKESLTEEEEKETVRIKYWFKHHDANGHRAPWFLVWQEIKEKHGVLG